MLEKEEIKLSDFLKADERLATGSSFTMEKMLCGEEPVGSEDDDITVEKEVVSFEEAQRVWSIKVHATENREARCDESVQSVR